MRVETKGRAGSGRMTGRWLGALALAALAGGAAACADDAPGTVAVQATCKTGRDGSGKAVGCVAGALTSASGQSLEGLTVSACTLQTCVRGTTNKDGVFSIEGLPIEPHKMEVLGVPKGFATICFYRDITAGTPSIIDHVVRVPALPAARVPFPTEAGGTAEILAGRLSVEAAPGVLKYPLGTEVEEAGAVEVAVGDLPPYDIAPWQGKEAKSHAFVVQPFPLKASASLTLTVLGEKGVAAGAPYRLYAANALSGKLEEAGMLIADASGKLVMQPGGNLLNLTTLVVVPN